jgi:hypothetical protein
VDLIEQLVAEARRHQAEPRSNRPEELGGREAGIDQQDHRPRVAEAVHESAREHRLAGADVADQQGEVLFFDRILEPRERLFVLGRFEQE